MLDINALIEKLNFTNDVSEFLITYTLDETEYERYKKLFYEDFMLFLKSIKSKEDRYLFSLKLYICLAAECTLSEYLSQSRFKMRLQRSERDRTGKAEITRDRANLTETILRVCDSNNEKNGQNFISVFEMMKNKRIIG